MKISLRSIPVALSFSATFITSIVCISIAAIVQQHVSDNNIAIYTYSVDNSMSVAKDNLEKVNTDSMRHMADGAVTFVTDLIAGTERTARYHRNLAIDFARSMSTFSTPELLNRTLQAMYQDISTHNPATGFFLLGSPRRKLRYHLGVFWDPHTLNIIDVYTNAEVFLMYGDGTTYGDHQAEPYATGHTLSELNIYVCPLMGQYNPQCNTTLRPQPFVTTVGNLSVVEQYGPYPLWMEHTDLTFLVSYAEAVMFARQRNAINQSVPFSDAVWTPLFLNDYSVSQFVVCPFEVAQPGMAAGVAIGLDLRTISSFLKKLPKTPQQRVFIAVVEASTAFGYSSKGNLIGVSHGLASQLDVIFSKQTNKTALSPSRLNVTSSSDPIIRAAGEYVAATLDGEYGKLDVNKTIKIPANGTDYLMQSSFVKTDSGISWVVVVMVPWNELMGPIEETNNRVWDNIHLKTKEMEDLNLTYQTILYACLAGVAIILMFLSYITSRQSTQAIEILRGEMEQVSVMNLEAVHQNRPQSMIAEVASMQDSFLKMVSNMEGYRSYMPEAILVPIPTLEVENIGSKPPTPKAGPRMSPRVSMSMNSSRGSTHSLKLFEDESFNTLQDCRFQTGLHTRKICLMSIYMADIHAMADENPSQAHDRCKLLLASVVRCAETYEGIIMQLKPEHIIICWNGHRTCINKERKAVQCATDITHAWSEIENVTNNWIICIAAGSGVVGSAQAAQRKTTVVVGALTNLLEQMNYLVKVYPQTVLITDKVKDAVSTTITSKTIDVLLREDDIVFISQLLSQEAKNDLDLDEYNEGFAALQSKDYATASEKFLMFMRMAGNADMHAVRLYQISEYLNQLNASAVNVKMVLSRKFLGWEEQYQQASRIKLPNDIAELQAESDGCPSQASPTMKPADSFWTASSQPSDLRGQIATFSQSIKDQHLNQNHNDSDSDDSADHNNVNNQFQLDTRDELFTFKDPSTGLTWKRSAKLLGAGAYAEVYLGMGQDGGLVALKTLQLKSAMMSPRKTNSNFMASVDEVLHEVSLLSALRHENIVGYIGSCVVDGVLLIVMEYVPGGSLASLIKEFRTLDLEPTKRYVRDVVRGLTFLHRKDVIHQDVKPHNVLLMIDGQCKLTDFGASAKLG
eukprot:PhF_6_TR42717/c0_g2_i1/m.64539